MGQRDKKDKKMIILKIEARSLVANFTDVDVKQEKMLC